LKRRVAVRIETPRGSFVKRDLVDGELVARFASPYPCPFDYGHVPGETAGDGQPRDAVWLGPRAKALDVVEGLVAGIVRFEDGGDEDDKWIVNTDGALSQRDTGRLHRFFRLYAAAKRLRGGAAKFVKIDVALHSRKRK
jgi:inorganic pyrophosphatase